MSAFEVTVTPTRFQNKKRLESREPTDVIMAPFSAKSIVQFEDVPVTKTAKRILRIINPSEDEIEVKVTKPILTEHNVTIDWMANIVPAQSEIEMQMVWNPLMEVACKETMHLTDNRNFRKDIMIILKSKSNKPLKNTRKFPTISSSNSHITTLRLKSPTNKAAKSIKGVGAQVQQKKRQQKTEKTTLVTKQPKKQTQHIGGSELRYENANVVAHTLPLTERNVYSKAHHYEASNANIISPNMTSDVNKIAKENISPITPNNVLNLIDNLKFTPATVSLADTGKTMMENLSSLPTPVYVDYHDIKVDCLNVRKTIRPRRITAADLLEEEGLKISETCDTAGSSVTCINTITNKTFEVNRNEGFETSIDIVDEVMVLESGRLSIDACTVAAVMNNTTKTPQTPKSRPLDMIVEEESSNSPPKVLVFDENTNQLQETYVKPLQTSTSGPTGTPNLKRDIKLIGTPLRKYSESMKDLSMKSPQSKYAIQGSMPNLNEMENIRSIEQNRYYYASVHNNSSPKPPSTQALKTIDEINVCELQFNQNEILAQSSRFNLNEVGLKSRRTSPIAQKPSINFRLGKTPPKAIKKICPHDEPQTNTDQHTASQKRFLHELSFSDSPSSESLASSCSSTVTSKGAISKTTTKTVSPPKRARVEVDTTFQRPAPLNASMARNRNWSQIQPKKLKLAKTLSLVKKPITPRKIKEEPRIRLYDSELYLQSCINPDPFAATTTCDPFLTSTMYLDEQAVDKHQTDFKKWLNALVSIPADLDADCNAKIDVGKLFNEVRHKELTLAPTKEEQSMNYLTKFRLESLRRAAVQLFLSEEMRIPCSKVAVFINKDAIRIRNDRNLHLDVVMQRYILELLLFFNPLWLRLGLEVVYGEKIHLHSNNDIVSLSTFILNRLFRDKFLEQKYSRAYTLSEEYAEHIKKFTLQKMLFLLLFLDKAKSQRIIKHNPCLFVKKSPHKETREILLKLSSELLANVGDITRDLRRMNYVLQHKQSFLDEFDYAFNNLAVDLRDGIRLTRVMEIILLRDDLSKSLRVPAISRLQRVFNVNLALRALKEADFELGGDIVAADIVDGHREKTLSLLWQIIYKFRSPKFHAAARVIQHWWRNLWLRVVIKRRICYKAEMRRSAAATKIQTAFRALLTRRYVKEYRAQRCRASTVLQKYVRRYIMRQKYVRTVRSIIHIQHWYRATHLAKVERQKFVRLRNAAITLQRCFRRRRLAEHLLQTAHIWRLQHAQKLQAAANCIQTYWRGYCRMKLIRMEFLQKRHSTLTIQCHWRAQLVMKQQRRVYLELRNAVITIQHRYRAKRHMLIQRQEYLSERKCIVALQRRRRALITMRAARLTYVKQYNAIVTIQKRLRATLRMRQERAAFKRVCAAVLTIQKYFRSIKVMQQQRRQYHIIRQRIIYVQLKWRATLLARRIRVDFISLQYYTRILQQKYRATKQMHIVRKEFLQLKTAAITVQRHWRAKQLGQRDYVAFQRKLAAVLTLQRRFRAYKQMRFMRAKYRGTQAAVVCLQQHVRSYLLTKRIRSQFLKQQRAAIVLQRFVRARIAMNKQRAQFNKLRVTVICLQRRFRANAKMHCQMQDYLRQRQLIIVLQRRFRAKLYARQMRNEFILLRETVIKMQRRFRANLLMRQTKALYESRRAGIIRIQRYYRGYLQMRCTHANYQQKRSAAMRIQYWYRSILLMRLQQQQYQRLRSSALTLQKRWRALCAGRQQRQLYMGTMQKVILIQRHVRATLHMRRERLFYQRQQWSACVLQRRFRARCSMLRTRSQYLLIHSLIICIQRKYRAHRAMLQQRSEFLLLRKTVIHLQQKYRGRLEMRKQRNTYLLLRSSAIDFQSYARGFLARKRFQELMTPQMRELLRYKRAAKIIQRYWRGYRTRKRWNNLRIVQIRKNIALLKKSSNAINSIHNKMKDAVHVLSRRGSAAEMLNVLMRLDRLSRTVPHLLMKHSEFISTFCYSIMAMTIRSEVDKQVIRYCSRIILNLARYNSTTANTFQEEGLRTIAQMLLRWCDKDSEIFNTLCTLIWIFAHCPLKREIIYEYMTTPEAIYVVRETKKLVARKEKMKQNVRKSIVVPRNGTQHNFSSRALPSLSPDYGVVHKKPYTFISSVYAFDTILCKLGIDIF